MTERYIPGDGGPAFQEGEIGVTGGSINLNLTIGSGSSTGRPSASGDRPNAEPTITYLTPQEPKRETFPVKTRMAAAAISVPVLTGIGLFAGLFANKVAYTGEILSYTAAFGAAVKSGLYTYHGIRSRVLARRDWRELGEEGRAFWRSIPEARRAALVANTKIPHKR